jgi:ABC-type uncharacterized transport system auxiliary subunit
MDDTELYNRQRKVIDFLLGLLQKTAIQMLARQHALETLCTDQNWQNSVAHFEHLVQPEAERMMESTREAILSKDDESAFALHPEWTDSIRRMVDDIQPSE